jgi:iduronate 2-sulfatase
MKQQLSLTSHRIFHILFALGAAAVAKAVPAQSAAPSTPPNVLFIAVDDLNTRIACYGDPIVKTPNLDRLARRGIRFERAYCQFPVCNPSRMSLLLGRYPTTTETVDFARPALLERDWVTLTEHFRAGGYQVDLRGKIYHFPEPAPWSAGEEAVLAEQEAHRKMIRDLTRWEPYRTLAPPTGRWVENLLTRSNVFRSVPDSDAETAESNAKEYEWTADVKNASQGIALLRQNAKSGKPFFLGIGFYKPHVPLVAPKRFFDMYAPETMPLPEDFAPTPTAPDNVPRYALRYNLDLFYEERPTPERARAAIAAYYACITFMDEQLGRVLDELERLGLRDNTVIVLWGDHGWHLGEKGMWAKGTLFEVSAHAPLIIVDPRKATAGQACARPVEFVDIYPTLVELCGLEKPPGLEGASLAPLLDNPRLAWDRPAYTVVAREDWLGRSVRTERWSFTEWDYGRRGVELYDLQSDPRESKNVALDPQNAAEIAGLKRLLRQGPIAGDSPIHSALRNAGGNPKASRP